MRDNLFRSADRFQLGDDTESGLPLLTGHFVRFNEWTEIDSVVEGHFMERIAPGALSKTIRENQANMRVLFQHGRDPQIGDKPLGTIRSLNEDDRGAAYEVEMLDTAYNRELLPGLRAGLYGASMRARVTREDVTRSAPQSDHNPDGLPEVTIREMQVREFGPVTFGQYTGATAIVRSLTDDVMLARFIESHPEKLRELLDQVAPIERTETSADENETPETGSTSLLTLAKARVALQGRQLAGRRA